MAFIIVGIVILGAIIWVITTTNGFKRKEIKVEEALSGIEVALTKRYDMLTKLLDTAKGYMAHEKDIFSEVVKLRKGMTVSEMNKAEQQMSEMSQRLFAVAESYPELHSSDVFIELQSGIRDAEEHLQAARRLYNSNITIYNTAITMFPASIFAGGRQAKDFFEAEEYKKRDITMSF